MQPHHHAAFAQLLDVDQRLFWVHQRLAAVDQLGQQLDGPPGVRFIGDAHRGGEPPHRQHIVIGDIAARKAAVGDGDDLVIGHPQRGVEQPDLDDGAFDLGGGFDVIAGFEGVQEHDDQPARKIGKAALQRQTDRYTDRTEQRHKACGRDA